MPLQSLGTNSGMDYWTELLDKFLHLFLEEAYVFIWLLWVIVVMSQ